MQTVRRVRWRSSLLVHHAASNNKFKKFVIWNWERIKLCNVFLDFIFTTKSVWGFCCWDRHIVIWTKPKRHNIFLPSSNDFLDLHKHQVSNLVQSCRYLVINKKQRRTGLWQQYSLAENLWTSCSNRSERFRQVSAAAVPESGAPAAACHTTQDIPECLL